MKILLLNYEYPPVGGGGGVATKKLAEGWVRAGHEVTVLTSHYRGLAYSGTENGVKVIRVPVLRRKLETASFFSMALYNLIGLAAFILKKVEFDVINTHFSIPTGPLGILISILTKKPNVLSIHGADIYDPSRFSPNDSYAFSKINSFILRQASVVVAQSRNTIENAKKYYSFETQIEIVPLPYDNVPFPSVGREHLGLNEDDFYLISVGRLVRRKRFDVLIKALGKIANPHVKCLVVGDGPEREELERISGQVGVSERIEFLGSLSEDKKFQYLSNSNLYVLSSDHEGFGIVLQEAMQVGLPIVSTNVGGQVDLLEEGTNAKLVDPGNVVALVVAIEALVQDDALRSAMGIRNTKSILRYSSNVICQEYEKIFRSLIR